MNPYERAMAMWSIQDTLLQYYRSIFITSQSILFSVAVGVASGNKPAFAFFFLPIGIAIILGWIWVCRGRGLNVYYFHWQLLRLEKEQHVPNEMFTAFKDWQLLGPKNQRKDLESDEIGKALIGRQNRRFTTRKILDFWLPLIFAVLWMSLAVFVFVVVRAAQP